MQRARREGPATTDEEAEQVFQDTTSRAGTLFRALDTDGDGVQSRAEIAAFRMYKYAVGHPGIQALGLG